MVPAFGPDMPAHFCIQINGPPIIAPRSAKENAVLYVFGGQPAFIKNKTTRLVRRKTHRCGQIAIAFAVDVAILENSRGLTKYKIDMAFNIAVLVKLSSILGVKRVLPCEESAMFKNYSIGIGENGNRLRSRTERIL